MTSADYRVLVSPASDPSSFAMELPFTSIQFSETLNEAGSATVDVPLRVPNPRSHVGLHSFSWDDYGTPVFRFTADDLTGLSDGDTMTEWPDAGSNGVDPTVSGSPVYRATEANGHPAVELDGATKFQVSTANAPTLTDYTVLAVFRTNVAVPSGSNDTIVDSAQGLFSNKMLMDITQTGKLRTYNDSSMNVTGTTSLATSEWYVGVMALNTTDTELASLLNRESEGTDTAGTPATVDGITIGAEAFSGANYLDGDLAAVLVWDSDVRTESWFQDMLADVMARYRSNLSTATAPDFLSATNLGVASQLLWVERAGVLVWGGIIWGVNGDVSSNSLSIAAGGFHSYTRRRFIRPNTLSYSSTDQLTIARDLIDQMEAFNGSLGIINTSETSTSGVLRDREYSWWLRKNYGEAIDQLAAVNDGFDFRYALSYQSGVPTVEFVTSYPKIGRSTSFVFDLGSNVELLSFQRDGASMANEVDALGEGEGPNKLIKTATSPSTLATYPLLQSVVSFTDVTSETTLGTHAQFVLARGLHPIDQYTVRLAPSGPPTFGAYLVGDRVNLRGEFGYLSVDDTFRITSISVSVGGDGEVVDVSLASANAFETV